MNCRKNTLSVAIAASIGIAASTSTLAQTSAKQLEEIVVTAQKREQALTDVPMSVQAITAEQLELRGTSDYSDLLQQIPSASYVSATAPGFETIQIRGISSGTTGDAVVAYYVDEVAFGIPNLQIAPPARFFDLERVEVIRGPQGTLYGQGAMGGMVKFVTQKPSVDEFSAKVRAGTSAVDGGDNGYNVDAVINVPVSEQFAFRASIGYEDIGGFADAPDFPGEDVNGAELSNARLKALWMPSDTLSISASYWTISADQDFSNTISADIEEPTIVNTFSVEGFINTQMDTGDITINWDLPAFSVVSATSYTKHELDFIFPLNTAGFPSFNDSTFLTDSITQELRLVSNDDESAWSWVVGGFYRDAEIDNDILYLLDVGLGGINFPVINTVSTLSTESYNIFAELSVRLLDDKVEALVGLSYFDDTRDAFDAIDYGFDASRSTPGTVRPPASESFDSVNPRFNLKYYLSDDSIVFANIAKGFRSGAIQSQGQVDAAALIGVPTSTGVDPDEVWSYELGTKMELLNNSLLLEASLYYTEWSDIQIQFTAAGVAALANGGEAEITGLDVSMLWLTPIEGLTFQLSGNVNEAEFTSVEPRISESVPAISNGNRIPNAPESNMTVSGDYSFPLAGELQGFVFGSYAYRSEQLDTFGLESGELDDVKLRIGVRSNHWTATLYGNNLLNDDDAVLLSAVGGNQRQILRPRTFGLEFTYEM